MAVEHQFRHSDLTPSRFAYHFLHLAFSKFGLLALAELMDSYLHFFFETGAPITVTVFSLFSLQVPCGWNGRRFFGLRASDR